MSQFLSKKERKDLRRQHCRETERRYADRIKALLLWDEGWTLEEISHALLIEESSIRRWREWYEAEGLDRLLNDDWGGSECRLSEEQRAELVKFLAEHLCNTTAEICDYVSETFGITYTLRGMQHLLKRLGFVYKKTKSVPGKADPEAQRKFVRKLNRIKSTKSKDDPVYYMDGTHPLHTSRRTDRELSLVHDRFLSLLSLIRFARLSRCTPAGNFSFFNSASQLKTSSTCPSSQPLEGVEADDRSFRA